MIMPTAQDRSPFDFNHMGSGSDKSDELGVPYYNGHSQLTFFAPALAGSFSVRYPIFSISILRL